jgi:hypothetical protein
LSSNFLSGTLPAALSELTLLKSIDLSSNFLSGTLPAVLSELTLLGSMDLSSNRLAGTLPTVLSELTLLKSIDLSSNILALAEWFPADVPDAGFNGTCNMRDQCSDLLWRYGGGCYPNTQASYCSSFSADEKWIQNTNLDQYDSQLCGACVNTSTGLCHINSPCSASAISAAARGCGVQCSGN